MNPYIDVMSTLSTDKLLDEQSKVLALQAGGPALFIESALKSTNIPYKMNYGNTINVEILLTTAGEFGRVRKAPNKQSAVSSSGWVIVSTILDEWQLSNPLPDKLFVDLQGYVRDGTDFGKKQPSKTINRMAGEIFCLKGTKEEVSCLSESALERQKRRLLLITDGDQGVELFYKGLSSSFSVNKISGLSNTIGAGDTFLAYFVASMFRGGAPKVATQYAIDQTSIFLRTKSSKETIQCINRED